MFFARMTYGHDGNLRYIRKLERDFGIQRFAERVANQIHTTASRRHPACAVQKIGGVFAVFPTAHAHFAEIIHSRPDKIAYKRRVCLCKLPEGVRVRTKRFTAQNYTFGIFLDIVLIAFNSVVISCDVHYGKAVARLSVATGKLCHRLHKLIAEKPRKVVEKLASDLFVGIFFSLFVAVLSEAERVQIIEKYIYPCSYGAVIIVLFANRLHIFEQFYATLFASLRNLVSEGIHYNGRVVIVLFNHISYVAGVPVDDIVGVVVTVFMYIPHIAVFVHYQHTQLIAGVQKRLCAGVVCGTYCVVTVFF